MILTLLKALNTTKLQEVVGCLSMAPLDIDLLLYDAQDAKQVAIDKKTGKITALLDESAPYYNSELASKLLRIVRRYDEQEANITRNRLEEITLDLAGSHGYPIHDFICTLYALEQGKAAGFPKLNRYEISVPGIKGKRPPNTFVFYTLVDHQEYGAKAVNDFIEQWGKMNIAKGKK